MCCIEREMQNFILNLGKFSHGENSAWAHGMKSDEKLFFCHIYAVFREKWGML